MVSLGKVMNFSKSALISFPAIKSVKNWGKAVGVSGQREDDRVPLD